MSRFAPLLNTLNDSLVLPQSARARVLLEVAGDLEAFFDVALEQGRSPEEAERLAVEAFHPSSQTVTALVRLHGSPVALLMDGLSRQAGNLWERVLLAIALLPAGAVSLSALQDLRIFRVAGWPAWPLAGFAAAIVGFGVVKLYLLFIKLDHRPRVLRRGLELLFGLSLIPAPLGLMAFVLGFHHALGAAAASWPEGGAELGLALLRGTAVMTLALTTMVLGLVVWFFLTRRIARIEIQEAELLLTLDGKGDCDA